MNPKIYVACLASYNNGKLHGKWIDANQDVADIQAEIDKILQTSTEPFAEEWAIHDYEGFGEISLSEWSDLSRVSSIARLLEEHEEAFAIWYQSNDGSYFEVYELEEKFLEQWQGVHDSEADFAQQLLEDTGALSQVPEWMQSYFDFNAYARDLSYSGDYTFTHHDGQVYVFSSPS